MRDEPIERVMTPDPVTIRSDATIVDARRLFESRDMHHLPVVDDGKLVGIVSTSDLLKFLLLDDDSAVVMTVPVSRIMQRDPEMLTLDVSLRDAAQALSSGSLHALPVTSRDGSLAGIVTSSDLIRHLEQRLQSQTDGGGDPKAAEDDIPAAIEAIETAVRRGELSPELGESLRRVADRSQALLGVVDAAERYIRSGHAEHEHSLLIRCLERLRRQSPPLGL